MAQKMIVDVHNHILPPKIQNYIAKAGALDISMGYPVFRWRGISYRSKSDTIDVKKHMNVCKEAGLTHVLLYQGMVVTMGNELGGVPTIKVAKVHNDFVAKVSNKYPGLVYPVCTVKPHDGIKAIEEIERCINDLNFKAVTIDTSYGSADRIFNHTVETFDFWEYINDHEIPVILHPGFLCYGWEYMDRYKFEETIGRPNESGLSISLMIMSGLFDRFPKLKIVLCHMGGAFMMILPRLRFGHRIGYEGLFTYQKPKNKKEPLEYVKENLWVDTMGFDPAGIKHSIEVFGIDHVLLGTDYGPVPFSPKEHITIITNELGLSTEDQNKILGLNAKKLFNLPDPS
ncbi:MAG: amidohydrolase family protein [Candidatus Helarchaeota archaeon]